MLHTYTIANGFLGENMIPFHNALLTVALLKAEDVSYNWNLSVSQTIEMQVNYMHPIENKFYHIFYLC